MRFWQRKRHPGTAEQQVMFFLLQFFWGMPKLQALAFTGIYFFDVFFLKFDIELL